MSTFAVLLLLLLLRYLLVGGAIWPVTLTPGLKLHSSVNRLSQFYIVYSVSQICVILNQHQQLLCTETQLTIGIYLTNHPADYDKGPYS